MADPPLSKPLRNDDVDWNDWPVEEYLAETYRTLYPSDVAVIEHHSAFYRKLPTGGLAKSLELGAGPNLYPLMLASAASQHIDALEKGDGNVEYLRRQLRDGPDDTWEPFYALCRKNNPMLPASLTEALAKVRVVPGDALDLRLEADSLYDLASMHFLAESVTQDAGEFAQFCRVFIESVRPGGFLVAAFMERMGVYHFADDKQWPAFPVDGVAVREAFVDHTVELEISRVEADQAVADGFDATGMVLLTARRAGGKHTMAQVSL